jgi:hypothetical protein
VYRPWCCLIKGQDISLDWSNLRINLVLRNSPGRPPDAGFSSPILPTHRNGKQSTPTPHSESTKQTLLRNWLYSRGLCLARGFGDAAALSDSASHKSDPFDHFCVR